MTMCEDVTGARLCCWIGSMGFWVETHASVSHIGETGQDPTWTRILVTLDGQRRREEDIQKEARL